MTGKLHLDGDMVVAALDSVRMRQPRVHCLTNAVAQALTANMLLAVGAQPSMTASAEEIAEFVLRADVLLVNLGTLDAERRGVIAAAIDIARDEQIPWVLDPVLVNASGSRLAFARQLLEQEPALVRANAAELEALAGEGDRLLSADRLALDFVTTFAVTGQTDKITDGVQSVYVGNGDPMMAKVTAIGCALTAVAAAFLTDPTGTVTAVAAALACGAIAGEVAAERAAGPGTFEPHLLDALYGLDADTINDRLDIT